MQLGCHIKLLDVIHVTYGPQYYDIYVIVIQVVEPPLLSPFVLIIPMLHYADKQSAPTKIHSLNPASKMFGVAHSLLIN